MIPRLTTILTALMISVCVVSPPAALVPGDNLAHAYSTKCKGLGAAGIALPQDALAPRLNPAGIAFVGSRLDTGVAFSDNRPSFKVIGAPSGLPGTAGLIPQSTESDMNNFVMPTLGLTWSLDERRAVGLTVFATGYMGTEYSATAGIGTGIYGTGTAGTTAGQLFVMPTYAQKMGASAAWGVSGVLAVQRLKATGLSHMAAYVSDGVADNLSDRGWDSADGVGGKLGMQADVRPNLTLAASYQTKIRMSQLKKYSDLIPDHGHFNIPPTAMLGLAWRTDATSVVVFDIEQNWYSDSKALGNPSGNLVTGVLTSNPNMLLGGPDGPGKGWRDVTTYKLGYQWQSSPAWTWRVGTSYGRQPVPASDVTMGITGPSVAEWRFTAGLTREIARGSELNVALMYSPRKRVTGANPLDPAQSVEISTREAQLEMTWGRRF